MKKGETFDIEWEPLALLFSSNLSEKHRRYFYGLEAIRIGVHGVKIVSELYNVCAHTVRRGKKELMAGNLLPCNQVRCSGGGRKKKSDTIVNLISTLMAIIQPYTAGSPVNELVQWTNLTWTRISELLKENGLNVGRYVVKNLMKQLKYGRRKMAKCKTMIQVAFRNEQFEYIKKIKKEFLENGLPVLSIDTKLKELIGNFYRNGVLLTHEQVKVYDHDFKSFATGTVVPHGIYDILYNICYLTLGHSKDTAEFMCDNIRYHWKNHIKQMYPLAKKMLLLCDGGGSNGSRYHVVKEALHMLAVELDMEIVVAHYPSYCSKWNPIEHFAFCHIARAWQGIAFSSYQIVEYYAKLATTKTGFSVKVSQNEKIYETGKKASKDFMENYPVKFNKFLPQWNYSLNALNTK